MPGFEHLDGWEVVLMVGYQCAVMTVFFFLVGVFLGMAVEGMILVGDSSAPEITVLMTVHQAFNYLATLFMFVSPAIIGAGMVVRPN